jgi:chromate reductase
VSSRDALVGLNARSWPGRRHTDGHGEDRSTAALRTLQQLCPEGVEGVLYGALYSLPHFNPDDDADGATLAPAVVELRAELARADAVLFSTPEYAGALPGSFKNLLDWTVGGGETYGKPVAWVNTAGPAAPTGAADAHAPLRSVLGYTGAEIIEEACLRIPVARQQIGSDRLIADPEIRARFEGLLSALALRLSEPPP